LWLVCPVAVVKGIGLFALRFYVHNNKFELLGKPVLLLLIVLLVPVSGPFKVLFDVAVLMSV